MNNYVIADDGSLLLEGDGPFVVHTATPSLVFLTAGEQGPPGPPGTGDATGEDGQVWTADGAGGGGWEDPAATGATPQDIANVMAFAAAHG